MVVMIRMLGWNVARKWHGLVVQMHGYSHMGIIVFSWGGGAPRWVHAFTSNVTRFVMSRCLDANKSGVGARG